MVSWRSLHSLLKSFDRPAVDIKLIALITMPGFGYISIEFERKRNEDFHASLNYVLAREKSANLVKIDVRIIGVFVLGGLSRAHFLGGYRPALRDKGWMSKKKKIA